MDEFYEIAVLHFFEGKPREMALYEMFAEKVSNTFPGAAVRVQKSQITFSNRHNFTFASLPVRRKKGWPEHCIIVTFGLSYRLDFPRIAVVVEPYPNRWTHHVVVSDESELDAELMGWIGESYHFSESKK